MSVRSLERQDDVGRVAQETSRVPPSADDPADVRRIKDLPKEVGAMLVSVGVLGFALPGMIGTPAIIAGGLVLWPRAFGKVEGWFQRRHPALYRQGMRQVGRYLDDLERRYSDLKTD
jgi:hypothetical protein